MSVQFVWLLHAFDWPDPPSVAAVSEVFQVIFTAESTDEVAIPIRSSFPELTALAPIPDVTVIAEIAAGDCPYSNTWFAADVIERVNVEKLMHSPFPVASLLPFAVNASMVVPFPQVISLNPIYDTVCWVPGIYNVDWVPALEE